MKNSFTLFIITFFCISSLHSQENSHMDFLKEQKKSAKEYVISLFKTHDIVILCERDHKEFTQYELFLEIVKDPYFIEHAGHIFTEVGVANMDDKINSFLQSKQKDTVTTRNQITEIFREMDSSPYWHCFNFPWFIKQVFDINQSLPKSQKLMLHPSDIAFDWYQCKTPKDYKVFDHSINNRDSMMAQNIIQRFDHILSGQGMRKKALVIMNYKHAFLKDHRFSGDTLHNTGRYLSDKYNGKVASVYIMGLAIPKYGSYSLVKNGKWDSYFERSKKTDVGFNLTNSPFGAADFDVIPADSTMRYTYNDFFTGLVFYRPVQEHKLITGWQDFATGTFVSELRRRIHIYNEAKEMGLTKEDMEDHLFSINTEKSGQYNNIKTLRKEIEQWQNGN